MRRRFTLGALMGLVVLAALGLSALKNPTPLGASALFTLDVALFGFASLGAAARQGKARMPWLGFASFGWLYLALSFGPLAHSTDYHGVPPLVTGHGIEAIHGVFNGFPQILHGNSSMVTTMDGSGTTYYAFTPKGREAWRIGHALGAPLFALLGGFLGALAVPRQNHPLARGDG